MNCTEDTRCFATSCRTTSTATSTRGLAAAAGGRSRATSASSGLWPAAPTRCPPLWPPPRRAARRRCRRRCRRQTRRLQEKLPRALSSSSSHERPHWASAAERCACRRGRAPMARSSRSGAFTSTPTRRRRARPGCASSASPSTRRAPQLLFKFIVYYCKLYYTSTVIIL